jgi:hypothetical protein
MTSMNGPSLAAINQGRTIMSDRWNRLVASRWTYIILVVALVVFFVLGNQGGGKNGNPFILGVPICLLMLLVFGVGAGIRWRSSRRRRNLAPVDSSGPATG